MKTIFALSAAALLMGTTAQALPVGVQPEPDYAAQEPILLAGLGDEFRTFLAEFGRADDRYSFDDDDDDDDDDFGKDDDDGYDDDDDDYDDDDDRDDDDGHDD